MDLREKRGIYEFTKETKSWPHWKDGCLALLNSHYHYFVVLDINDEYCEGFMFTSAPTQKYPDNMPMRPSDFEPGGYTFSENTHFLTVPLKKFHYLETKPEPVAWLSEDGEKYIRGHSKANSKTWEDYVRDYCADK